MGGDYKVIEHRLQCAVHVRCGLRPETPAALKSLTKKADIACAYFEAVELAGFDPAEAKKLFGIPKGLGRQTPAGPRSASRPGRRARRRKNSSTVQRDRRGARKTPLTAFGSGGSKLRLEEVPQP